MGFWGGDGGCGGGQVVALVWVGGLARADGHCALGLGQIKLSDYCLAVLPGTGFGGAGWCWGMCTGSWVNPWGADPKPKVYGHGEHGLGSVEDSE